MAPKRITAEGLKYNAKIRGIPPLCGAKRRSTVKKLALGLILGRSQTAEVVRGCVHACWEGVCSCLIKKKLHKRFSFFISSDIELSIILQIFDWHIQKHS